MTSTAKTGSLADDLQHHVEDPEQTIKALRKELQSWENAMEAARTTITYLEQRGKEKQKRIRELEAKLTELERKS